MEIIYLTLSELLFIHEEIVRVSGGAFGERDLRLLDSAIHRPQATFGGEELYPTIYAKAAALCHSLILNHGFVDGNKRTAITASITFLRLNGYMHTASNEEVEDFAVRIVEEKLSLEALMLWFMENTEQEL